MILSAQSIRARKGMIEPFLLRSVSHGMSHGLGPSGFDCRVAEDIVSAAGAFILVSTIEKLNMPTDVAGDIRGKSTWIRRGLIVHGTAIEAGWSGHLTLGVSNHSGEAIELKRGMGICQVLFMQLNEATELPYKGKYNNQPARPVKAILQEDEPAGDVSDLPASITGLKKRF